MTEKSSSTTGSQEGTSQGKLPEGIVLKVKNVHKFYGDFHALKGISFEVKKGRITGFLGPNGAGKTTTMKIINTFMPPSLGEVFISDGEEAWEVFSDPIRTRRYIGYLPENFPAYHDLKVKEFLEFVARLRRVEDPKKEAEKVASLCGLTDKLNWFLGHLSKGYRQRVGIAQAIIGDPKVLLLDEPTQALDPIEVVNIRNLIRELSKDRTVILSTHIMYEVEKLADDVIIINRGEIIAQRSLDELRREISDTLTIELVVLERTSEDLAEILKGLTSNFKEIKISPRKVDSEAVNAKEVGGVLIELPKSEEGSIPQLHKWLVDQGLKVLYFNLVQRTVEDIFLELVRKHEEGELS